jgi:hypothetical protein
LPKKECSSHVVSFEWKAGPLGWGGTCYEILKMENNQNIKSSTETKKCRPLNVTFKWKSKSRFEGSCYEIDAEKGRSYYSKSVSKKKCRPDYNNLRNVFVPKRKGHGGRCVQIDKETNGHKYAKTVDIEFCRLNE